MEDPVDNVIAMSLRLAEGDHYDANTMSISTPVRCSEPDQIDFVTTSLLEASHTTPTPTVMGSHGISVMPSIRPAVINRLI